MPNLADTTRTEQQRSQIISGAVENARRLAQMFKGLETVADALTEIAPLDGYLAQLKRQTAEAEETMKKRQTQVVSSESQRDQRIAECAAAIRNAEEDKRLAQADHANTVARMHAEITAIEAEHAEASAKLAAVKAQLRQLASHGE